MDGGAASRELTELARLDEILQVMYWMRGEGFGSEVAPGDLAIWLGEAPPAVEPLLERLADRKLVRRVGADRYRLTDSGVAEAGRRFADEFADITKPGHGECGDPSCDCATTGDPAACSHRRHAPQG